MFAPTSHSHLDSLEEDNLEGEEDTAVGNLEEVEHTDRRRIDREADRDDLQAVGTALGNVDTDQEVLRLAGIAARAVLGVR